MKSPLVSVIVNCHNGQKYLSDCIKSILNQTYKNLEIIFWNNFSNDNSLKIINSFQDKRIKKFSSKKYLKLYDSRNLAIRQARGKYITFCDTDDFWTKNKISEQIKLVNRNKKIKIIYSNFYVQNDLKKKKYLQYTHKLPSGSITQKLLKKYVIGILTIMIDKKIFEKNKFNQNYNIIGDFDFFIKLSTKYKFYSIQKPLAIYRLHENNFSLSKKDIYISELKKWLTRNSKQKVLKKYSFLNVRIQLVKLRLKFFLSKYLDIKLGM